MLNIKGIGYLREGKVMTTQPRELHKSLDKYPSPYSSSVIDPIEMYNEDRVVTMFLSRGCVFNCRYCNYSAVSRHRIHYHSVEYVMNELRYIMKKGQERGVLLQVQFVDDLFTANHQLILELCTQIQAEDWNLPFRFHTRSDFLTEELIQVLKKSGCTRI